MTGLMHLVVRNDMKTIVFHYFEHPAVSFRGTGTGLADLAAAGLNFPVIIIASTIKREIVTFTCNQANKNFYCRANACYCFNEAFVLLQIEYYIENQSYKLFEAAILF